MKDHYMRVAFVYHLILERIADQSDTISVQGKMLQRPRPRSKWLCETESVFTPTARNLNPTLNSFYRRNAPHYVLTCEQFFSVLLSDLYANAEDIQILEYFRNNFMTVEIVKAGILQRIRFRVKNKVRFIFLPNE